MTYKQFLTKLKAVTKEKQLVWQVDETRAIRVKDKNASCPIEALGGKWWDFNGGLGLGGTIRKTIVNAADYYLPIKRDVRVRKDLLKTLGLKERFK